MSISQRQRELINEVINAEGKDDLYPKYSRTFLQTYANAKKVEQRGLESVADFDNGDGQVIKVIAKHDFTSGNDDEKKIQLFVLQHRSGYDVDITGSSSNEICCLLPGYFSEANSYVHVAQHFLPQLDENSQPDNLKTLKTNGYFEIKNNGNDTGVYYIGENGVLIGQNKPYAFAYSTSTAACLYGDGIPEPIIYNGYAYEAQSGRTGYATGGAVRKNEFYYLTPGGGPITEDNWIIRYAEYGTRIVLPTDTGTTSNSSWVYKDDDTLRCVVKLWIHFFFPNGAYCRTCLDRSDSADFSGKPSSAMNCWIYSDYSNSSAAQYQFTTVWNKVCRKELRPVGGIKPSNIDTSLNWNHNRISGVQQSQIAYSKNSSAIWQGGGIRL